MSVPHCWGLGADPRTGLFWGETPEPAGAAHPVWESVPECCDYHGDHRHLHLPHRFQLLSEPLVFLELFLFLPPDAAVTWCCFINHWCVRLVSRHQHVHLYLQSSFFSFHCTNFQLLCCFLCSGPVCSNIFIYIIYLLIYCVFGCIVHELGMCRDYCWCVLAVFESLQL